MATLALVDNDLNILETARDILEDAGYDVRTVESVKEAMALIARETVDLVIVDFNLPDGSGLELAERLHHDRPPLPILLMTGEAAFDSRPPSPAIRAVLLKPVDPPTLLRQIQQALA